MSPHTELGDDVLVGRKPDAPGFATLEFLTSIDDAELREEIRVVLREMELLSESRASSVERSAPSSEKPLGPPEFRDLSATVCPPEDRSLHEHFVWRFRDLVQRGASKKRLWFLLWDAEHALKTRTVPPSAAERQERVAMVLSRPDEAALKKYLIDQFEGEHAYRVHLQLKLPVGWVEKVREDEGRDPDYGFRRPRWRELSDSEKAEQVALLRAADLNQEEACRRLGVSKRTVASYWSGKAA
jgi:hypothetical protein